VGSDSKATIKDVAKLSGVGIATVSRVINGNYPVSDAVREAVWAAIDQLGYRPNVPARSLKTRKSRMVGVVVADLSNLFFMQLVKGLEAEAAQRQAKFEESLRAQKTKKDLLDKRFQDALKRSKDEPVTRPVRDIDLD
jgi:DNA-binding LacI/PurR family transcriptional regulator